MGAFTGPGFNSRRLHKTFKPPVKYLQGVFVTWKQSLSASNILPLRTPNGFSKIVHRKSKFIPSRYNLPLHLPFFLTKITQV